VAKASGRMVRSSSNRGNVGMGQKYADPLQEKLPARN
jgi:hypothetical protein